MLQHHIWIRRDYTWLFAPGKRSVLTEAFLEFSKISSEYLRRLMKRSTGDPTSFSSMTWRAVPTDTLKPDRFSVLRIWKTLRLSSSPMKNSKSHPFGSGVSLPPFGKILSYLTVFASPRLLWLFLACAVAAFSIYLFLYVGYLLVVAVKEIPRRHVLRVRLFTTFLHDIF